MRPSYASSSSCVSTMSRIAGDMSFVSIHTHPSDSSPMLLLNMNC